MYLGPDFPLEWLSCGFFSWEDLAASARELLGV
jgi:hypothetical protein